MWRKSLPSLRLEFVPADDSPTKKLIDTLVYSAVEKAQGVRSGTEFEIAPDHAEIPKGLRYVFISHTLKVQLAPYGLQLLSCKDWVFLISKN